MEALTRIERSLSLEIHTLVHWQSDKNPAYLAQQLYNRGLALEASEFADPLARFHFGRWPRWVPRPLKPRCVSDRARSRLPRPVV